MKTNLIVILILLLTFSCNTKNIKSDLEKLNIKGNVHGFVNIEYYAKEKFGEIEKDTIVKDIMSLYSSPTNYVKTFNKDGNIMEELVLLGGQPEHKSLYYYNNENKVQYLDILDTKGKLLQKIKYDYSEKGLIQQNNYNSEGNLIINVTSILDDKHRTTQIKMNNNNFQTYTYNGDTTTVKYVNGDSHILYKNNILKKIYKGEITEYRYNENGDLTEEVAPGIIKKYLYKYDAKKNWIEKKTYLVIGDKVNAVQAPYKITFREIFYTDQDNNITIDSLYAKSNFKKDFDEEVIALNIKKFCNKETVISLLQNHIKSQNPNLELFPNTISIVEDGNRKYLIGMIVRDHFAQNQMKELVLEFTYNESFTNFLVFVKSEKNI